MSKAAGLLLEPALLTRTFSSRLATDSIHGMAIGAGGEHYRPVDHEGEERGRILHCRMPGQVPQQPQILQTTGKCSAAAIEVRATGLGRGFWRELGGDLWRWGPWKGAGGFSRRLGFAMWRLEGTAGT